MDWLNIIFTLLMLVLLQAVLGFDNLLYISLESKRAPKGQRARVRKIGIGLAVVLRIVLLFALTKLISVFVKPFLTIPEGGPFSGTFNVESVIVLFGGVFIIYTATKEIFHMLAAHDLEGGEEKKPKSAGQVIFWIVLMNLVFSFDSILSAMALTDNFWIMATAIVIGGLLMILLADTISNFLEKNRLYEVLGLFILFIVGIMLLSEGAHKAHIHLFGQEVTAMSKATFYFVLAVLVLIDVVQGRYQKKLLAKAAKGS
jgi:predicted tellurium resistance membrane protein TerC